ncbi:hypothetical protein [Streptomyces qinglanensis]|uniref:Uncharacterized protein n=1 Tax=Streptomyces qinglanensis TaxID=943816 RepID=A0A1H9U452_9ACTN|nr:hypothetical protein [Streptomyces qinglanensis]SES03944.1 hypothetical protein SAMN05421870_107288 [Streptomyces qinglanensis]
MTNPNPSPDCCGWAFARRVLTDPARQRETLASLDRALETLTPTVAPDTFRTTPETTMTTPVNYGCWDCPDFRTTSHAELKRHTREQHPPPERCGDLSPTDPFGAIREECVLHPGHYGSHANDHGTRWQLAERCVGCDSEEIVYHNYRNQPFCEHCANCSCRQTPCARTAAHCGEECADGHVRAGRCTRRDAAPPAPWVPIDLTTPIGELINGLSLDTIREVFRLLGKDIVIQPAKKLTVTDDFTPPPPGSTREQLPDHLLRLIDVPPYTSTACETARECERVVDVHTEHAEELRAAADHLHDRCRRNNKFTGVPCGCDCHGIEEQP